MGKLSYEKSGVSISGGDAWVETIKSLLAKHPKDKNCVGGVGGFAGLYRIGGGKCLAGCTDGVGTKLELAKATGLYRGLGQDLVAMNVNDLVTVGARPLFFLDYAACGRLDEIYSRPSSTASSAPAKKASALCSAAKRLRCPASTTRKASTSRDSRSA